jgi:class 3 adenylate cyclase/tetratricopeptide (TPR) repeat protein
MTFDEILTQVTELLQRQARVSYRALKRRFDLDDDYLEDLKAELIDAQQVASDEGGTVLVWTGETTRPGQHPDQERTPRSYTPLHLAQKILQSKAALEGERKQVTVLFADLKGSLELLADHDAEEARQLLDPVLERMIDAVHRYEGTVNQVLGDGIMALFGAPLAHEDHAVRACYAALRMQEAIGGYAEELRRRQGLDVQIRVGLNSGQVVVRAIGSDLHMDYTAVGQTTHLAARMEQLARPGTTLLAADTLRLVEGFVEVKPWGPVPVKGLASPIEVYELLRARPVRSRLQAAAARGLTRFVGRDAELEALRRTLERARQGHGQAVAVVGEPGVGKSRLFYEFLHSHRTRGWLVLESASVSYGRATAYFPVLDLLKRYFQIEDRDETRSIRAKVTGQVLTLDEALQGTIPALLALLDALPDDHPFQALEPLQRREHMLEAVRRLLLRESSVQPLLLVIENLHWIDNETQALLDNLVGSLPTARLLLLTNYRPEYQHGWGHKTYYTQLRLDPLPSESAEELLQALLGDDTSLTPLKALLISRTEGNPFFLEESVQTLAETQALVGERGAYRLAYLVHSVQVPATVQAVLAARIDRLPPEDKRLLQTAAVIGTDVPFPLLQAIAELPEAALRAGLARLQVGEFLYETRLFPELEYTFKHALTHEVAYGSLLQERRRALHARIVEALEALAGERLAEHVERLAQHARRGELWAKALAYYRQAGARAAMRSAHREAVACYEQALVVLQQLSEVCDTRAPAIDLRLELRNVLLPLAEYERILEYLCAAETLAQALDDRRRLGQVSAYLSTSWRMVGDPDRAVAAGRRALAIADTLDHFPLQILAHHYLGLAYYALGDYRQAIDVLAWNVRALVGERCQERFGLAGLPAVISRTWLVWCLAELGAFAEGLVHGEEAVRIAEGVDHPYSLVTAYYGLGLLHLRQGDLHQAIPILERSLRLCQDATIPDLWPGVGSFLGSAYALLGRLGEALPLLAGAVEQTAATRHMAGHAAQLTRLGEAHLLAGRPAEAIALVQRALELARQHREQGDEAWALRLLGGISARHKPAEAEPAEVHYRQALALAAELGMRPLVAHCHRALGTLYAKLGRREQAYAELTSAMKLYRAMEMTFWLVQTEAAFTRE